MGILDNLEAYIELEDKPQPGYSTGKWSDDDDFGITPFLGPNR